mmetsp:Transcript_18341/g.46626  ORF Transcript_18341/g.46626 Transcript_18341/m.46626 type:complete len:359 (-) Transcript_18341:823-1899(-)
MAPNLPQRDNKRQRGPVVCETHPLGRHRRLVSSHEVTTVRRKLGRAGGECAAVYQHLAGRQHKFEVDLNRPRGWQVSGASTPNTAEPQLAEVIRPLQLELLQGVVAGREAVRHAIVFKQGRQAVSGLALGAGRVHEQAEHGGQATGRPELGRTRCKHGGGHHRPRTHQQRNFIECHRQVHRLGANVRDTRQGVHPLSRRHPHSHLGQARAVVCRRHHRLDHQRIPKRVFRVKRVCVVLVGVVVVKRVHEPHPRQVRVVCSGVDVRHQGRAQRQRLLHHLVVREGVHPNAPVVLGILGAVRAKHGGQSAPLDPAGVQLGRGRRGVPTNVMAPERVPDVCGRGGEARLERERAPGRHNVA